MFLGVEGESWRMRVEPLVVGAVWVFFTRAKRVGTNETKRKQLFYVGSVSLSFVSISSGNERIGSLFT